MAYLEVAAFKKLRAFFWALQKSSFNLNKIPFRDNEGTPVDKAYCLNLLRSFPDFQAEAFKEDNFLIKYLSKPGNLKQILDQFTPAQQIELTKVLEEKPIVVEIVGEQPGSGETSAEQGVPAQTPVGTATGAMGVPGLPSIPSISFGPRRVVRIVQQTKTPGASQTVAGLKTTPETGLDFEGKPYRAEAAGPIKTAGKNLTSQTQIGIKKGLTKVGGGFSKVFAGAGRGLGGMLGGVGGGGVKLISGTGGALSSIGTQMSRGSIIKGPPVKFWFILLGAFLLIGTLTAFAPTPGTPGTTPGPSPTAYTPGAGSGIISCPLNKGVITAGSKDAGGHCSSGYQTDYPCIEPDTTGRASAIDLQGTDRMVFLPNIGGNTVNWFVEKVDTDTSYLQQGVMVNGGYAVIARAESGGKTYRIRFVHIELPNVQQGQLASSATPVGPYRAREDHVHITIQENGVFQPADLYFNLCK